MVEKLVLSIVTFSILGSIIGDLISDTTYKKYISGLIGILMVIMIVGPVIDVFDKGNMEKSFDKWTFYFDKDEYALDTSAWEDEYIDATMKEYENVLEKSIKELTKELCEVVECKIEFDNQDVGPGIRKIDMIITTRGKNSEAALKDKKNIKDVIIEGVAGQKKDDAKDADNVYDKVSEEVREMVSEYLGIDKELINVALG